jgi:ankyrin repeat protein
VDGDSQLSGFSTEVEQEDIQRHVSALGGCRQLRRVRVVTDRLVRWTTVLTRVQVTLRSAVIGGVALPPLFVAVLQGRDLAARALVRGGADPNAVLNEASATHNDVTVLRLAAYHGNSKLARLLVELGADTELTDGVGRTPLIYAAVSGDIPVIEVLVALGADMTAVAQAGLSPLMFAAFQGHAAAVGTFINLGAAVNMKSTAGFTALNCAARNGHTDVIALLLDGGADMDIKDRAGRTALVYAAHGGHGPTVRQLIDRGAGSDPRAVAMAAKLANSRGHADVVALLADATS